LVENRLVGHELPVAAANLGSQSIVGEANILCCIIALSGITFRIPGSSKGETSQDGFTAGSLPEVEL
jgi:hypothetical protein